FIELICMKSTTSEHTIRAISSVFARHGIPNKVICDNGPQFCSTEFVCFGKGSGFGIRTSSLESHQSNGLAEKAVNTAKRILKKNPQDPPAGLLAYRASPLACGYSPSQLLYGRQIRTSLPALEETLLPAWPDLNIVR